MARGKLKKIAVLLFTGLAALSLYGCIAVMATIAHNSKAKQTLNVPYGQALDIVKASLKESDVKFKSARIETNIAQVKGTYKDGRTVRIFISPVSENESLIAVRVGTTQEGKEDAERILRSIIESSELAKKQALPL